MSYVSIKKKKEDTTTKCHVRSWIRFCNNKVTLKKKKAYGSEKKNQHKIYNTIPVIQLKK